MSARPKPGCNDLVLLASGMQERVRVEEAGREPDRAGRVEKGGGGESMKEGGRSARGRVQPTGVEGERGSREWWKGVGEGGSHSQGREGGRVSKRVDGRE